MIERSRSQGLVKHAVAARTTVEIVGAGAIGSNLAYLLSKMGIGTIDAQDCDVVAAENIEPLIFQANDIGRFKVSALQDYLLPETKYTAWTHEWKAGTLPIKDAIVVGAVDSMESRRAIALSLKAGPGWKLYIDGRMGGNIVEAMVVKPDGLRDYWRDWIVGVTPLEIPCSHRAVAYNGMMCASLIARLVAAFLNDEPLPKYVKADLLGWAFDVG